MPLIIDGINKPGCLKRVGKQSIKITNNEDHDMFYKATSNYPVLVNIDGPRSSSWYSKDVMRVKAGQEDYLEYSFKSKPFMPCDLDLEITVLRELPGQRPDYVPSPKASVAPLDLL
jgi:hypothetical protein